MDGPLKRIEMLSCNDAERLIARDADAVLPDEDRARLDAHLSSCASCRAARAIQREVAALLRSRAAEPADLASKVAARLDDEAGILGLANWRAWTLGLAPLAAALLLAVYFGVGASTISPARENTAAVDEWAVQSAAPTPALLQPGATGDTLVEEVLFGTPVTGGESRDVR